MQRVGSKLEISKLASELMIHRDTIRSYLNFLESTYFIFLVSPFSRSRDREVSGARKIYFCDTGILNNLSRVSEGTLFENLVFLNLRKFGKLNYYQRRIGAEIDFILQGKKLALEAKLRGGSYDLKLIQKNARRFGLRSYVITKHFNPKRGFVPGMDL